LAKLWFTAEPCDLCLSKAAILKLWRYLRSTDSPNFFTVSEGLLNKKGLALWRNKVSPADAGLGEERVCVPCKGIIYSTPQGKKKAAPSTMLRAAF